MMTAPTFEQTYVKYPFAPLVTLALSICAFFVEHNRHNKHSDHHIDLGNSTPHSA